jgi:hypothetical protein
LACQQAKLVTLPPLLANWGVDYAPLLVHRTSVRLARRLAISYQFIQTQSPRLVSMVCTDCKATTNCNL